MREQEPRKTLPEALEAGRFARVNPVRRRQSPMGISSPTAPWNSRSKWVSMTTTGTCRRVRSCGMPAIAWKISALQGGRNHCLVALGRKMPVPAPSKTGVSGPVKEWT